ncbi:ATP-binding protein [Paraburkholderia atlantica]|uniref:ATP-binding protein n=1 Tax=Paraburkholderia atlantica TaxID=2654982 RepID=UPI003D1BAB4E
MTELEQYLTNQYPSDIRDIEETEKLLVSVAEVYRQEFNDTTAWSYELRDGEPTESPPKLSQSTTAMILDALLRFGGYFQQADMTPGGVKRNVFAIEAAKKTFNKDPKAGKDKSLGHVVRAAGSLLTEDVFRSGKVETDSSTYGKDDIFTLAWIAEVASADWASLCDRQDDADANELVANWGKISASLRTLVLAKAEGWKADGKFTTLLDPGHVFDEQHSEQTQTKGTGAANRQKTTGKQERAEADVQAHAFTVLRLVQALKRLSPETREEREAAKRDADELEAAKRDADELEAAETITTVSKESEPATKEAAQAAQAEGVQSEVGTDNAKEISECLRYCYQYFERLLHEQLSFSSIPDSRFDPAELMFCLEGMLICQRNTVDRTIFDRVLSVLTAAQKESAYWRPVKPFLTTRKGYALFPVSVEIANSLMRACAIFDENDLQDTYGSHCVGLLRRYWQWLRARAVRVHTVDGPEGGAAGGERVGWHSEHVNARSVVHLWETSQVMEFLLSFRNALHRHIARTTLVLSRFTQSPPKDTPWSKVLESHEPVSPQTGIGEGEKLSIYYSVRRDFVIPRLKRADDLNYSMLLYGPPGTGKTTIASGLANALKRRFITITVSDFLGAGEAQLEARAKDIFTVLMSQPDCVVLFDEIDHFLLDRDSERYGKQDTVYQFMTPGMLTKLNDLRRKERCLFIVATNYEDRIDAAIKRTGRIDHRYLVLPPDAEKRKSFIKDFIGYDQNDKSGQLFDVTSEEWTDLAQASLFLGYSDIEGAVKEIENGGNRSAQRLIDVLKGRARTTSLEAYQSRFFRDGNPLPVRETPIREFLCLLALYCEAHGGPLSPGEPKKGEPKFKLKEGLPPAVKSVVGKCYSVIEDELPDGEEAIKAVSKYAGELNERARRAVVSVLLEFGPEGKNTTPTNVPRTGEEPAKASRD